jgi:hypothetical protein
MPTVAIVDGIRVDFYFDEHHPPHFHVKYGEYRAMIRIDNLKMVRGSLPRPQYRKIMAWASTRRRELDQAWYACESDVVPEKIK